MVMCVYAVVVMYDGVDMCGVVGYAVDDDAVVGNDDDAGIDSSGYVDDVIGCDGVAMVDVDGLYCSCCY